MKDESPRELYGKLESRLSPLLRDMLAHKLPVIAGSRWWEICVLSSLSPVQRDNMRDEATLEQFDYPALVNIVYKNWKSLRHVTGIGNEFTNYLFTIKTFRNDVEHQPDLMVSGSRREHVVQAAQLAEALLTGKPAPAASGRRKRVLLAAALAVVVLVAAGAGAVWNLSGGKASGQTLPAGERLSQASRRSEEAQRIQSAALSSDNVTVRLKKMVAYSHFAKKGLFGEADFNANYEELTQRIRRIQAHYGMPATGTPDDELQALLEEDKVPLELMR